MKKALGYIIMVFSGLMLFANASQYVENNDKTNHIFSFIAVIFAISLYIIGRWLVKRSNDTNKNTTTAPVKIYFDRPVSLNFKLSFKEYWQGMLTSIPMLKIIFWALPIIGIFQLASPFLFSEMNIGFEKDSNIFSFDYFHDKQISIIITLIPIVMFLAMKLTYEKTSRFAQNIGYYFNEDVVSINGGGIESKVKLESIHKVKIDKNFILIFFLKNNSNIFPKRIFIKSGGGYMIN